MKHYTVQLDYLNCLTEKGMQMIRETRTPERQEELRLKALSSMIAVLEPKHKQTQP